MILEFLTPSFPSHFKNYNALADYAGLLLSNLGQVSRNIDLVYGGGSVGLMGSISQAVYDGGRHVIG